MCLRSAPCHAQRWQFPATPRLLASALTSERSAHAPSGRREPGAFWESPLDCSVIPMGNVCPFPGPDQGRGCPWSSWVTRFPTAQVFVVFPSDYYSSNRQRMRKLECWRFGSGAGVGLSRESWKGLGEPSWDTEPPIGFLSLHSSADQQNSLHPSSHSLTTTTTTTPCLLSVLPTTLSSLPGPWRRSTRELENRALACLVSLARPPTSTPHCRGRGCPCPPAFLPPQADKSCVSLTWHPPPHPMVPCTHAPVGAWTRVQGEEGHRLPLQVTPLPSKVAQGHWPESTSWAVAKSSLPRPQPDYSSEKGLAG